MIIAIIYDIICTFFSKQIIKQLFFIYHMLSFFKPQEWKTPNTCESSSWQLYIIDISSWIIIKLKIYRNISHLIFTYRG